MVLHVAAGLVKATRCRPPDHERRRNHGVSEEYPKSRDDPMMRGRSKLRRSAMRRQVSAKHKLGVTFHERELPFDFLRQPAVVGIKERNIFSPGKFPADIARPGCSTVLWETNYADPLAAFLLDLPQYTRGVIAAIVIYQNDFERSDCLSDNALDRSTYG